MLTLFHFQNFIEDALKFAVLLWTFKTAEWFTTNSAQKKGRQIYPLTSFLCQKFINALVAMESKPKWNHNQNIIIWRYLKKGAQNPFAVAHQYFLFYPVNWSIPAKQMDGRVWGQLSTEIFWQFYSFRNTCAAYCNTLRTRNCFIVLRGFHFHLCCGVLLALLYSCVLIMGEKITRIDDTEAKMMKVGFLSLI